MILVLRLENYILKHDQTWAQKFYSDMSLSVLRGFKKRLTVTNTQFEVLFMDILVLIFNSVLAG